MTPAFLVSSILARPSANVRAPNTNTNHKEQIMKMIKNFLKDESGMETLEYAVIGGLIFATVATLIFVPVVFSMVHKKQGAKAAAPSEMPHVD